MGRKTKASEPPSGGDPPAVEQFLDLLARLIAQEHLRRWADEASAEPVEATTSTNKSKAKKPEETHGAQPRKRR